MAVIPFAEWTPDAADLGSSGAVTVTNAVPSRDGYQPFKSLSVITDALESNQIDNPLAEGTVAGSAGTIATDWASSNGGLTRTIGAVTTSAGITYVPIQLAGVAASTLAAITFEAITDIPAENAQEWEASIYLALSAGSFANVGTVTTPVRMYAADGTTNLGNITGTDTDIKASITSGLTKFSVSGTTSNALTTYVQLVLRVGLTIGQAYDFTLWIGQPRLGKPSQSRPIGAVEAFDIAGVSYQYVGNATKLFELDADNLQWTDVSNGTYSTASTDTWEFARWENKILATNFADSPQQITMGGANFTDLTTDLKARHIAVIGDFIVFGNTYDGSDGNRPNRVRWSAQGDETDYTVSQSTLSDFRDLTTGGAVQRIMGGEVGIIVCERSVFRMSYIGAPVVFQIDEVLPDIGTSVPGSVCRLGDNVYFLSAQGFVELVGNGTGVNYIGAGKVDRFFLDDLDPDYLHRMSCLADPTTNRIAWAYPGSSNSGGTPNKIIIYDRTFAKWSLVEENVELLLRSTGLSVTLDELDALGYTSIDAMDVSLDSAQFKGAANQFGAFDASYRLGFFRGLSKSATLVTQETELNAGVNTQINAFRPLVDRGTVMARVGYRRRLSDDVTWSASLSQSSSGRFTVRANGRFHRFELTVTGNDWTDAIGVIVDPKDAPRGSGRA